MAPDQKQCRLPTPPVALDDALPAPASARRPRPHQPGRLAVNAHAQSRLAAGDVGHVVHALVHVSPLLAVLHGSTDDSSLPSAGRGMTRMHNLCAQRQRAIDMKVSHIAPGGLRPSAMHEPREISKQTNNHSGPAIYVHYGADPGRTHPRTLATVARFPRPESAPAVASTIWSRRRPGANFTYGPLLHHHARDVMIGIYSYIQR